MLCVLLKFNLVEQGFTLTSINRNKRQLKQIDISYQSESKIGSIQCRMMNYLIFKFLKTRFLGD